MVPGLAWILFVLSSLISVRTLTLVFLAQVATMSCGLPATNGRFSVRSAFQAIQARRPLVPWYRLVWSSLAPLPTRLYFGLLLGNVYLLLIGLTYFCLSQIDAFFAGRMLRDIATCSSSAAFRKRCCPSFAGLRNSTDLGADGTLESFG